MPWEFHHKDIKMDKLLGEGEFASVYLGEVTVGLTKQKFAIKKVILKSKTKYIN